MEEKSKREDILQNESVRKDVAKTHPAASIAPIQSSTM
jgi:hypothetical protein